MSLQFPSGPAPVSPQLPLDGVKRAAGSAPQIASPIGSPIDTTKLLSAASTMLELDFLLQWGNQTVPAAGIAAYQAAQAAARGGQPDASLRHLEQAILAHPSQAAAAASDPAFDSIRGPVLQMLAGLTRAAHFRAEGSIALAASALGAADRPDMAAPRAYIEVAQALLESRCYESCVRADLAGMFALQLAIQAKVRPLPRAVATRFKPAQTVSRLWYRLPLLAILLVWFCVGLAAGLVSLLLPGPGVAAWRDVFYPIWGMALLGMIAFGVVRSYAGSEPRRDPTHTSTVKAVSVRVTGR